MNNRPSQSNIQGPISHHVRNQYEHWQDLIEEKASVTCTVRVFPDSISIKTKDLADFYLAKSAIKGRTNLEIVRAPAISID